MKTIFFIASLLLACTAVAQQPVLTVQHLRPDTAGQATFSPLALAPAPNGGIQLHYVDSRLKSTDSYLITDASGNVVADNGDTLVDRHPSTQFGTKYLPETQELTQWVYGVFEGPAHIGAIALRRWDIGTLQAKPVVFGGDQASFELSVRAIAADGKGGYLFGSDYTDTVYSPLTNTWYPVSPNTRITHVDAQGKMDFNTKLSIAKWGVGNTYLRDIIAVSKTKYFAAMVADYGDHISDKYFREIFLAGLNGQGDTLFTKRIAGYPYGLQPSNGGAILVSVAVDKDSTSSYAYPHLIKLDSMGNIEWEQTCRGAAMAATLILSQPLPDGGILLGYSSRNLDNAYSKDMFVARYSATGEMVWEQIIPVLGADEMYQFFYHPNGTIWVTGIHYGGTGPVHGTVLAKLTDATLLNNELAQSPLVSLWPNPVSGGRSLHVQLASDRATLELLDVQGRRLRTYKANSRESDIDVSGLANGVYLLQISDAHGSVTRQVVLTD